MALKYNTVCWTRLHAASPLTAFACLPVLPASHSLIRPTELSLLHHAQQTRTSCSSWSVGSNCCSATGVPIGASSMAY
eukprot:5322857-Amphidinium_carterae.1